MKRRANLFEWTKDKPDFPCLFITRDRAVTGSEDYYLYAVYEIIWNDQDGYNMLVDGEGQEWEALEDLRADEYMLIEDRRKEGAK